MRFTLALLLVVAPGSVLAQPSSESREINVTLQKSQPQGTGNAEEGGTYVLNRGGALRISNVSGDVAITGYDGATVQVRIIKTGRDQDLVEVEDNSTRNLVDLKVKYRCQNTCDAGLNFEVQVPVQLDLELDTIKSVSGNVKVQDFAGNARVRSASGDVRLQNMSGNLDALSASGNVELINVQGSEIKGQSSSGDVLVQLAQILPGANLRFSSSSGDVRVTAPRTLNAEVSLSTSSGAVQTTFGLTVQSNRYGSQSQAQGTVGTGGSTLRATSSSGSVSLKSVP